MLRVGVGAGHICIISSAKQASERFDCDAGVSVCWTAVHAWLIGAIIVCTERSRHSLRPLIRLSACDAFDGSGDFDFARMPPERSTIAADLDEPSAPGMLRERGLLQKSRLHYQIAVAYFASVCYYMKQTQGTTNHWHS